MLLAIARLLHIADLTAAAIRNPCRCDLVVGEFILTRNVFGPDIAADQQLTYFEIHPHFLRPLNPQYTVRQDIDDGRGHPEGQLFIAAD